MCGCWNRFNRVCEENHSNFWLKSKLSNSVINQSSFTTWVHSDYDPCILLYIWRWGLFPSDEIFWNDEPSSRAITEVGVPGVMYNISSFACIMCFLIKQRYDFNIVWLLKQFTEMKRFSNCGLTVQHYSYNYHRYS